MREVEVKNSPEESKIKSSKRPDKGCSSIRPDPEQNEVLDAQGIITSYHITSIPLIDQCRIGKSNSRHRLPRKAAVGGFPSIRAFARDRRSSGKARLPLRQVVSGTLLGFIH